MRRRKTHLVPSLRGVADGALKETKIDWAKEPAACIVLASKGYPDEVETGKEVRGLDALKGAPHVIVYHSATAVKNGKVVTVGGRVLGVTALGANLDAAVERAYEAVSKISFDGMQYGKDIVQKALARLHAHR